MSSIFISESELPEALTREQAVEAAYSRELAEVASKLQRGLPCLIECDKDLAPFLFLNVRDRLRQNNIRCIYLDGRPRETEQPNGMMPTGLIGTMISQLREAVRGAVERRVVVLPHLDLLTTSQGGLTAEAREVIPLLYENPELVWLGFKDPSFPLPKVIENLFTHRTAILGISRNRLRHLITRRESRKFGKQFNPWALYKYVSGVNALKLRKLLSTLEGEDYPADPKRSYQQLRQATLTGALEIPDISLEKDIGGYTKVKKQLRQEILDVLARRDTATTEEEIARLEELIPRGMIFWGPPGTGKTYFAKAMAAAIGAAITVVSGPELKSKWVGESEDNLRQIFHKARQSAPSIIVFDEIDSFATARGTYTGSGVEHSMVNQLLTEMDGFHKDELVFIVGTTNFVESLDPALLRPGRFEFHMHIPYPDDDDRRAILQIYNERMKLQMTEAALDYAVKHTDGQVEGAAAGTRYSGDHLQALCRSIARIRLRENKSDATTPDDIDRATSEYQEKLDLTTREEQLLATHEGGHAVCALFCPNHPAVDRITIRSETSWAPAYVRFKDDGSRRLGLTRNQILDDLCVLLAGREAEALLLDDVSTGAAGSDLARATDLAHMYVEIFGMGGGTLGLRQFRSPRTGERRELSQELLAYIDRTVSEVIEEQRLRATKILKENLPLLKTLRDLLIEKKTIDARVLSELTGGNKKDADSKSEPAPASVAADAATSGAVEPVGKS
ncbi:AAA family ATPase [Tuwongella immobilis]|uniref:AAA+ ATPase domain-containing protein n=1 Tax=Tuwongella immobilis TaxID=692036 RepID=A0A6C2YK85_9BACT|nr:AAA family ATPase [Tuwongella immobilis]VIP01988.1 atp-dependent metalloprotease : ATP-dependent metalloprotease FtsH OS=Myxococcus stipitatus (strain DSM 14675 / JCM 12634 / Mx s8) GN=MYSTI_03370 PE=4 SV=1: AAA: Peptidase_M41 [Tuwongella immobilis]VTS00051.1 atp-dependent metalloprotease : ATP-dependent metalloprotease FtsH OS=Myxococcus stipitatus (strain DSM 14675 / JCM 12634 / Mx s8) GN=MYSTI_03370 PE=4 SV=1: AAA: Peptidase_M41 [Tuwongella immobilis]